MPCGGETGGEGDGVLLGDADVEEAVRVGRLELGERGAGRHRGRDGDDPRVVAWPARSPSGRRHPGTSAATAGRPAWRRPARDGVAALAVGRRPPAKPLPFCGDDVEEDGAVDLAWPGAGRRPVARMSWPSTGPDVGEAELLPDHRVVDELLEGVLPPLAELDQQLALGQPLGDAGQLVLGAVVARVGADAVEVLATSRRRSGRSTSRCR